MGGISKNCIIWSSHFQTFPFANKKLTNSKKNEKKTKPIKQF